NGLVTWLAAPAQTLQSAAVTPAGTGSHVLAVAAGRAAEPRLAMDPDGNALAVWTDVASGTVRASAWPAAARAWQPPVTLSPTAGTGPASPGSSGAGAGAGAGASRTTRRSSQSSYHVACRSFQSGRR